MKTVQLGDFLRLEESSCWLNFLFLSRLLHKGRSVKYEELVVMHTYSFGVVGTNGIFTRQAFRHLILAEFAEWNIAKTQKPQGSDCSWVRDPWMLLHFCWTFTR